MVLQERNIASFQIFRAETDRIFRETGITIAPDSCRGFGVDDFRFLFHSIRDENPTLFGRKDRPVFPTGIDLTHFSEKIYSAITNTEGYPEFLFFVWKEDDSLNPYTRIRRTSFYLFCEKDRLSIIFGEWKRDIIFQNHYNFADWITAPRFKVKESSKQRFYLLENSQDRLQFNSERINNRPVTFYDWILMYKLGTRLPSIESPKNESGQNPDRTTTQPENSLNRLGERLKVLEDLKGKGLISEEEFKSKRKEILDSL